ncbi:helix-turn-helix domain-containing protein [Burkholderia oklahomensis]|uniref:helix-turn-helix domain-containing protein n=1 Tax=Burkholderia oklahomensis TaxID=342113 RepID=UPI00016A89B0|nr:helix-turn-helix domain-containing protein [Burkholderia oklahomensis]AJX33378.1 response regulator [Burkholderia oklahomensis C6786]AOI46995.1 two-component system response regulator [Burkholderia oklahomensis C6786]KUY59877.1 two-component system response regulator [Burkholderia oklahomensis C6786]MBI0360332.1 response regulator [Burkholderia oklahomensis]SUW59714.1 osmolarity response regulator [Burkholderia oklahomensis]
MTYPDPANADLITATKVRDLLTRTGIPPRSHNTTIANVLGLSFSVVTRKMKGQIPWNLSQLQDIASYFGVPPAILLDDKGVQSSTIAEMHDATLVIETRRFRCRAAISTKASSQVESNFVALQWQDGWIVYEKKHAPAGRTYPVEVIELRSSESCAYEVRIAVVDDSPDVAETICEYFAEKGVTAIAYYDGASFRKALEVEDFDGYILDWMLGAETAAGLVRGIRASENADAPIFLLTGKISTGEASEDEIADIVSNFNARCEEKPVRLPILFAEVARALKIAYPLNAHAS